MQDRGTVISEPDSARRIRALPALLVNQIAAGEVVERPASVVKELLDNAVDARAGRIAVELERGGIELIRVADDGEGIGPADLPLSVTPHATSKIQRAEDLEAIPTMGFRGEALASIASVSRLSIRSRAEGRDDAFRIDVEGGTASDIRPDSGARGTVVTVRNLFFNTPARRKFLRTPGTEQGHCADVVRDMALAQPNLGFTLTCDGRALLDAPPNQSPGQRAEAVLGSELAEKLIETRADGVDAPGVTIWGLLGEPSLARPTARGQHIFINGRPVRDRTVAHALQEGYRGLIEPGRKPVAVLLIEMDPALVDVNVHPAKAEVRFRDSGRVHSAVLRCVREALRSADLTPDWVDVRRREPPRSDGGGGGWSASSLAESIRSHLSTSGAEVDFDALRQAVEQAGPPPTPPERSRDDEPLAPARAASRVLQVFDTYLVTQDDDGVLIIDQHALHERVMFEKLMSRLRDGTLESQQMLTPVVVEATRAQADALERLAPMLEKLGVEARAMGPGSVGVHAFPTLLFDRKVDPAAFMSELLERAAGGDLPTGDEEAVHEVVDMMACKAAIKAGDHLSDEELADVLAMRDRFERSSNCPHGRPTTIRLTRRDLERRFGRS